MTSGQRVVVHIVAVVQVEPFFCADPVPQTAQLDGIRFLVAKQRVGRLFPRRFGPQLILSRIRVSHLQVVQSDFNTVSGTLVRSDGKRLALQQRSECNEKEMKLQGKTVYTETAQLPR